MSLEIASRDAWFWVVNVRVVVADATILMEYLMNGIPQRTLGAASLGLAPGPARRCLVSHTDDARMVWGGQSWLAGSESLSLGSLISPALANSWSRETWLSPK